MIPFTKYHGCGNHFIIVEESDVVNKDYTQVAIDMCHPHTGLGADGLMIVKRNPLTMLFYNQDGSMAPMCGNGIRCFANYVYDKGCKQTSFEVITGAGTMLIDVKQEQPFRVEINMGKPNWDISMLHLSSIKDMEEYTLDVLDKTYTLHSVFLGTIHTVAFVHSIDMEEVAIYGKAICEHPLFKQKTNVNFVCVDDSENIHVMTYERGVGITQACGTGCCASVVFANKLNKTKDNVQVHLPLGTLKIRIDDEVYMDGPAKKVASGHYEEDPLC